MPFSDHIDPPQSPRRAGRRRVPGLSWLGDLPAAPAWGVLVVGLLLTAILTLQYATMQQRSRIRQFDDAVDSMTTSIQNRLRNYNTVMNAAAGLFEGSIDVSPTEFSTFIHRLELETFYAGLQSIGFAQQVDPADLPQFQQRLRSYPYPGYADVNLVLADDVPQHFIVTHIVPQVDANQTAVGVDLAAFPTRSAAILESARRNAATATSATTLLPQIHGDDSPGIVVYMPVPMLDNSTGFVFMAFRIQALMSVVLGTFPHMDFEVYDGHDPTSDQLIYQRAAQVEAPTRLITSRAVAVAGRPWTVVFRGSPIDTFWLPALPLTGILVSILLALVVWNLSKARAAATARADQLRRQREWFAVTLASIGDAVLATDAAGRVTFLNRRAQDLTGWSLDEAHGRSAGEILQLLDEETRQPRPDPTPFVLQQQSKAAIPEGTLLVRRNGDRVPIDDIGAPIRSESGTVIGAVMTFRDVSERRRSEQALKESQARLEFVLDSAHVGEWDLDIESGSMLRSRRHDQIFGYDQPRKSWTYDDLIEHIHPDDRDQVVAGYDRALASGDKWDFQCRIIWPDQSIHWIEVHGSIYKHRDDRPSRMIGLVEDITLRREIEENLRRSEERFRNLVTATSSIIWTAGADGRIFHEVGSWEQFTGQKPADYFGDGWLSALHPEDREEVARGWEAANQNQSPVYTRCRLRHHSGEYRRVDIRGVPILDANGHTREWVGTITDVEEQQRVAEALVIAEQRFRWIVDSAIDFAIFTLDTDGKIDGWNTGAERVLGYTEEEILGADGSIIFTPEDRAAGRPQKEQQEALQDRSSTDERWHLRADGERFFAVGRLMTLRDDAGNVRGFVKILHDRTTERQTLEALERRTAELQESESRFRTMADSAPVFIWQADTEARHTWFNKPWLQYTGRAMEQDTDFGWLELVHPDDREQCLATFRQHAHSRQPFKIKYRLRRHDGEYRWLLDHGVPLHTPDDKFAGYIGSSIDITDLEQARVTLERYNSDLERVVNERTKKLRESNEQLRLAERMASLGTLAAGIGHDLGNLLLPMRIRLDILEQSVPEAERESVQVIRTAAEYLANLAKGLRYLAIDPERTDGTSSKTDLNVWWEEARPLLQNALPKNIQLQRDFPEDLQPLALSPAALTQAIFNLVQNSGNAMRQRGSGNVRIWAEPDSADADGSFIRVGVTDDGPGMDEETKRRCIEPFYSTKTREFSTGLGLSLVQGVVQRASGRLEVQTELGKGTTIILILPAAGQPEQALDADGNGQPRQAAVLVKDPRMRAFITSELKSMGYQALGGSLADRPQSPAKFWVVQPEPPAQDTAENPATDPREDFAKTVKEIVEEDDRRTIVLVRQPEEWNDFLNSLGDRVIPTSSTFKPSEIREALRKAASKADRSSVTHDHGEINH